MDPLERAYIIVKEGKIAIMRWPERPWPEMDDIPSAIVNVEYGMAQCFASDDKGLRVSIQWSHKKKLDKLPSGNAFSDPLALGANRLFVAMGTLVMAYDFQGRSYVFWAVRDRWITSVVSVSDNVTVLAHDIVNGAMKTGGEIAMLSSKEEVLWRCRPTFGEDDGFTSLYLSNGRLMAETWSSRVAHLDPETGQIIQSFPNR